MQYVALDVITSLSLGEPFGFVTENKDMYSYIETMHSNFPIMTFISAVPVIARIMRTPFMQRMTLPGVTDRVGLGKVKAVATEMISPRFGPEKSEVETRNDMAQSFIRHGLTQGEIVDETVLQILAGSDTAATILRAGFLHIFSTPRIYNRLRKEVLTAASDNSIPLSEVIPDQLVSQLPYLTACMKESLRYVPAASGLLPRKVGPEGDTHMGVYLPAGTEIGFCAWQMHRRNAVYGADADHFRPERWLEASTERLAEMNRAHDLVFGYGRFRCLGERIARIEMRKVFFEVMRRFDVTLLDTLNPVQSSINYGIFLEKGMWVRIEEMRTEEEE